MPNIEDWKIAKDGIEKTKGIFDTGDSLVSRLKGINRCEEELRLKEEEVTERELKLNEKAIDLERKEKDLLAREEEIDKRVREIEMEIKTKPIAEKRAVKEGEIQCIYCHGSGRDPRKRRFNCRVCRGKGKIKIEGPVRECSQCRGTGWALDKLPCLRCKGRGVISID